MLALPSPAQSRGQLQSALKQLATANHGDRCQTLSFQTSLGAVEWRTGQQDPFTGEWVIRKHTEEPNLSGSAASVGEPTIKTMTLHEGLSFFQAVTILSEYERGQLAMTVLPVNEASELGDNHVVAFAEREGIAFDTNGVPHPTLNGEVVTDGSFTKSALERARAFSRTQSAFFKAGNNDVLSQLLSSAPRAETLFDDVMNKSEAYSTLKKFLTAVEDIETLTISALEKTPLKDTEKNFILDVRRDKFEEPIKYPASQGHKVSDTKATTNIIRIMNDQNQYTPRAALDKLFENMAQHAKKLDQNFRNDYFSKGTKALRLYFDLTVARHLSALDRATQDSYAIDVTKIRRNVETLETRFKDMGGSEDEVWRVKSTIIDPNAPSIQHAMKPFITQLNTLLKNVEKEIAPLKKVIHAGTVSHGPV
ncbi:hypothetical protein [Micavibrio aeruginosavorus]|uniref:hypothetical protein n=1 Tax=Micavibrio aeruginosavorus TaxID=349221 RepID=UPI003F4AD235